MQCSVCCFASRAQDPGALTWGHSPISFCLSFEISHCAFRGGVELRTAVWRSNDVCLSHCGTWSTVPELADGMPRELCSHHLTLWCQLWLQCSARWQEKNGRTSLCTSSPIPVQHHCNRNPQLQHPAEGGKLLLLRIACSKASQLLLPTRKQHLCLLETNKLFQLA